MTTAMETLSPTERTFVTAEIEGALSRWNLPSTGPVRDDLESRARVIAVRGSYGVQVTDDSNHCLTLDARLTQLRVDPAFSDCFRPDPPKLSRFNHEKLHANFEAIRAGKILVE